MSASKQKKLRKEEGYIDPKTARQLEIEKANKKSNFLYTTIAVIFVLVAAFVFVWKSGVIQKNAIAVEIGDEKYKSGDVSYYSYNVYSYYYSYFETYYGSGSYVTYYLSEDSLKSIALEQLRQTCVWYNDAMDNNYVMTDEDTETYNNIVDAIKEAADTYGTTYAKYLKLIYGDTMTASIFENQTKKTVIAESWSNKIEGDLTYTDEEVNAYYEENKKNFIYASYEQLFFTNQLSTTDSDGNTITVTDEEKATKDEEAKEAAEKAYADLQSGTSLEALGDKYTDGSYLAYNDISYSTSTNVTEWVFSNDRKVGDITMVSIDDSGYYVLVYNGYTRDDYNTIDVRHILLAVDDSSLDSTSETYEEEEQALWDAKKSEIQEIYDAWVANGATEEEFITLANEKSEDSAEDGLYEQVYKDEMTENFNDWCFDESRKAGDHGIIETDYGYHMMYFVGTNLPYWEVQVRETMTSEDFSAIYESLSESYEIVEKNGIKYIVDLI